MNQRMNPSHGQGKPSAPVGRDQPGAPPRYRDDNDKLRRALLEKEAIERAEDLNELSTTQLRRFYSMVTNFIRRLDLDRGTSLGDEDVEVQMALLRMQATYADAKGGKNADTPAARIRAFVEAHAAVVKTVQDFRDFARHFEAIVAYHRFERKKKGETN